MRPFEANWLHFVPTHFIRNPENRNAHLESVEGKKKLYLISKFANIFDFRSRSLWRPLRTVSSLLRIDKGQEALAVHFFEGSLESVHRNEIEIVPTKPVNYVNYISTKVTM